jgi:hypothetical protein
VDIFDFDAFFVVVMEIRDKLIKNVTGIIIIIMSCYVHTCRCTAVHVLKQKLLPKCF